MGRGGAERSLVNLLEMMDSGKYEIDLLVFRSQGELLKQIPKYVHIIEPDKRIRFLSENSKRILIRNFSFKAFKMRLYYMRHKMANVDPYIGSQEKWEFAYKPVLKMMKKKYDVAIAYMHSIPSYYVIDKVSAKRKILWIHHDYSDLAIGKNFDQAYYQKADAIVTISNQCVHEFVKVFPYMETKIRCIQNLIPRSRVLELAQEYYPSEYQDVEVLKLVSIGRLNRQKGFDYAIDAAKILKDAGIQFEWYIIGNGELYEGLKKQIDKNGVQNCVKLLGERRNPYPYILNADIVVQTSRTEGKSIVLDEAKILCRPILTTNYTSVHDQIEDGVTGIIVQGSAEKIAEGLMKLLRDKKKMETLEMNLTHLPDETIQELEKYYKCFEG